MIEEICEKKKRGRPPGTYKRPPSDDKVDGRQRIKRHYISVRDRLEDMGFDPIAAMVEIAIDISIDIKVRKSAIKDLLDKTHPDLRAIEIQRDDAEIKDMAELKDQMQALSDAYISDH